MCFLKDGLCRQEGQLLEEGTQAEGGVYGKNLSLPYVGLGVYLSTWMKYS